VGQASVGLGQAGGALGRWRGLQCVGVHCRYGDKENARNTSISSRGGSTPRDLGPPLARRGLACVPKCVAGSHASRHLNGTMGVIIPMCTSPTVDRSFETRRAWHRIGIIGEEMDSMPRERGPPCALTLPDGTGAPWSKMDGSYARAGPGIGPNEARQRGERSDRPGHRATTGGGPPPHLVTGAFPSHRLTRYSPLRSQRLGRTQRGGEQRDRWACRPRIAAPGSARSVRGSLDSHSGVEGYMHDIGDPPSAVRRFRSGGPGKVRARMPRAAAAGSDMLSLLGSLFARPATGREGRFPGVGCGLGHFYPRRTPYQGRAPCRIPGAARTTGP